MPAALSGDAIEPADQTPEAFAAAAERVRPVMRLVASSIVGSGEADDVVQASVMTAMEKRHSFQSGTDFRAWLSTFVRNTARNSLRSIRRRASRERQHTAPRSGSDAPQTAPALTSAIAATFDQPLVDALAGLGDVRREALLLRAVGELSYSHIAAILEIEEATARSHVYRAREHLLTVLREDENVVENT